jgi:hypothetical protein
MRFLLILLLLAPALSAAPRLWREAEGDRAVRGEFVSRDAAGVTIRRVDRQTVTIPHSRLHPDDLAWLDQNHPLPKAPPPPLAGLLDTLRYGDTRAEVLAKLKTSELLDLTVNETYLARVGLNGVFRTRKEIGGLICSLSFGWTDDGKLTEITLDTVAQGGQPDPKRLRGCWEALAKQLAAQHGDPIQDAAYPNPATLQPGTFVASHLWRTKDGGTILLGSSNHDTGSSTTIRFTTATIEPNRVP